MLRQAFVVVFLFLFLTSMVQGQHHSVSPSPLPLEVKLPDGSSLHLQAQGNDFVNWSETLDGYTVLKNAYGYYEYAIRQGKELVGSGIRAYDPDQRTIQQMRQIMGIPRHLSPRAEADKATSHTLSPLGTQSNELRSVVPTTGNVRLLAICIEYPDLPHTFSTERMSQMLNEGIDGKPSFRDYFLENSYGQLDIQVDVAGWYTAENNFAYYGEENGKSRARELVGDALLKADEQVDYSQYDNDENGAVDGIIIIHSGPGAEEGGRQEYIWSHRWTVPFASYDNTFIFDYTIQPETRSARYGGDVGIGIFCHEFGHLLGLPDLYDTNSENGSSHGIGEWGLMGSGSWLGLEDYPAGLSAWSKERLGWITPRDITTQYGNFTLRPAHAHADFYRIETGRQGEYFLLENRQKAGYDAYLKGEGLAIWHINTDKTNLYPAQNFVNADENLKGVDLEEADGDFDLDANQNRGDGGDLYPGTSNRRAFNFATAPNSDSYFLEDETKETGVSLKNITHTVDGLVSFTNSRLFSNSGENCERALIAFEGSNEVPETLGWFEFTMPRDGSLQIDTHDAGTATNVALFLSCNDNEPQLEVFSENGGAGSQPVELRNLLSGQKVLIAWQTANGGSDRVFSFNLRVEGQVLPQDSLALVAMYQQLDGENWQRQQYWLQSPVSGWQGVQVENGRVVGLDFQQAGLKGELPQDIYALTGLGNLQIAGNQVTGILDDRISAMSQLESLVLHEPQLTVNFLPQLALLNQLRLLSLRDVEVDAVLPSNLGTLADLKVLEIVNAGLSGAIPASVGDLEELRDLDLSQNRLTGVLPVEIATLGKLESFRADQNLLSGSLPAELAALPALEFLSLEDNLLKGIPGNILSSNTLNHINLGRNRIQGRLPEAGNRDSKTALYLDLSENALTGSLGDALTNINFSVLELSQNNLADRVPALRVSTFLGLESNQFSEMETLPDVNDGQLVLRLARNRFSFDDLLPNLSFLSCPTCSQEQYSPQDTLTVEAQRIVREGDPLTYVLPYDADVSDNQYEWYRNNTKLPAQKDRSLDLEGFNEQQEGSYSCRITNPRMPGLSLLVRGLQIELKAKQIQHITVASINQKTFGDESFALQASSDAGLPLEYSKVSGPVTLSDNLVNIEGAGEAVVRVSQAGNDDYHSSEQEVRFTIAKAAQQIKIPLIAKKTFGDDAFSIDVTASSGLPVNLELKKGKASLSNQWVTIEGTGIVEILATRPGNENYQDAPSQTIRFEIAKAQQQISWAEIPDQVFGVDALSLQATSSSGLPVKYVVLSGNASITDGRLRIDGAGSVELQAIQAGDDNYETAPLVAQTIHVAKAPQTLFFDEIFDQELSEEPLTLEASSNAELPVTFTIVEGPARIEDGNQLIMEGEGEVTVEAFQAGNNNYLATEVIRRSFVVSLPEKQAQVIVVSNLPDTVSITETLEVAWSVSSGLEPSITLEGPAVLQKNALTFTASGRVNIRFEQTGNDQYKAAQVIERELFVRKASQIINVSLPGDVSLSDGSVQLSAQSSSGLPVFFRIIEGNVSIQNNMLNLLDSGIVQIEAYQSGDTYYQAADPVIFSFKVIQSTLLSQSIEYQELADQTYRDEPLVLDIASSSGLPLSIIAEGPVSLQGKEMQMLSVGEVSIRVFQKGNNSYAATDTVTLTFQILPAPQTINFEAENLSENQYLLLGQSTSGLPVAYRVISGAADIQGDTLLITGLEDVEIEITQAGDSRFHPAEPVRKTLVNTRITAIPGEISLQLKVSPNPSPGVFYVSYLKTPTSLQFVLYDSQGRLIKSWESQATETLLELEDQASGTYYLHVIEGEHLSVLRLIKQ